jgi:hypothetical protein
MDTMIIDGTHVHIRFSAKPGTPRILNFEIAMENNRPLGSAMDTWFGHLGQGYTITDLKNIIDYRAG